MVHGDRLSGVDPAGHPQGGEGRHRVRYLDQRADHRGLCDPRFPVRDPAAGAACGGLLLADLPAARADLGQLGGPQPDRQGRRLLLAYRVAGHRLDHLGLCDADASDQEQLSRRDQETLCHDRPRQGVERTRRALRARVPQRHADRDRRLPGSVHRHLFLRQPDHRDGLLARRGWGGWGSRRRWRGITR